ncbi:MAG: methionyl-tRNA formyltransferase [Mariprofundales bacterium]|nr:methionyl-tRNA formyltransferase [Mariprofundales bacterium]
MTLRVVFAGTPDFSCNCLDGLLQMDGVEVVGVVSQPDRRSGRGMKLTPSPVKRTALAAGIDVITPERLRGDDAALSWLRSRQPDLLVVVAFGMILPDSWLEAATVAPINVHASLLPRWRGAAPIERALLAGDTETGVCLMQMESGLDTGPVYATRRVVIGMRCGGDLWQELAQMGASLLVEQLATIAGGSCIPRPQEHSQTCYASKLARGERIIDWRQPAEIVARLVRCFAPKPGARSRVTGGAMAGKWLKILSGEVVSASHPWLQPGASALVDGQMFIGCGEDSCYRPLQLQPEGKQAMDADALVRGLRGEAIGLAPCG